MKLRELANLIKQYPQDAEAELNLIRHNPEHPLLPIIQVLELGAINCTTSYDPNHQAGIVTPSHFVKISLMPAKKKIVAIDELKPVDAETLKKMSAAMDAGELGVRGFDKAEFGPAMPYKLTGTRTIFMSAPRDGNKPIRQFHDWGFEPSPIDDMIQKKLEEIKSTQPVFPGQIVRFKQEYTGGTPSCQLWVKDVRCKMLPSEDAANPHLLHYYWEVDCRYFGTAAGIESGLPGNIPWPYLEFDELSTGKPNDHIYYDITGKAIGCRGTQGPHGEQGVKGPDDSAMAGPTGPQGDGYQGYRDGYQCYPTEEFTYDKLHQAQEGKTGEP